MTAISMMYTGASFLIAADGRCRADDESAGGKERETDQAQKVFPIRGNCVNLAWALAGFSSNDDGTFDIAVEAKKQADALSTGQFSNGHDYIHRFCLNIKRAVIAARRDGRIPEFPNNSYLPLEERTRKFRLFFVGYFKGLPLDGGWFLSRRR